jgi:hypothetical protein
MMAATVAPEGDCSIAITLDCFEPGLPFSPLTSAVLDSSGFAAATPAAADDTTDRFFVDFDFTDFDIEILRSVHCSFAPHHRSPTSATKPAGQDLGAPLGHPE